MKTNMIKYDIDKGRAVFLGNKSDCYQKMQRIDGKMTVIEDIEVPSNLTGEELLDFAEGVS